MLLTHNRLWAALGCLVAFLLLYGLTARGDLQISDEVATFGTAMTLNARGTLAIDELQWLQDAVNIGQIGRDGHLYAKYFPGNVFSAALVYRLTARPNDVPYLWDSKPLAASNTGARMAQDINALWGALAMAFLLLTLKRYFGWRTTIVTVVLVGGGTDWWYQSRGFLSEVGAGAFLMGCVYFMTSDQPYLSSLSLAVSLLFRPTNLLGLPLWGKTLRGKSLKTAIGSGFFLLASLLLLAFYNWTRFNSPFNFGYGAEHFNFVLLEGLFGVLLSPGRSLFIYSPLLILAIPGLWLMYQKEKTFTLACLSTIVSYAVAIAAWHSWDGGWSWGSRLLTPVVPLLGFFCAPLIDRVWKKPWAVTTIVLLGLLGGAVQVLALARNPIQVMNETVGSGNVTYVETLYTLNHSWLALQVSSLRHWQPCDLDAYWLRRLMGACIQ